MPDIDYDAPAGLFRSPRAVVGNWRRCQGLTFSRFSSLAAAIKNAVEGKPGSMGFVSIEMDDRDLDAAEIRRLYESADFPLMRDRRNGGPRGSRRARPGPGPARRESAPSDRSGVSPGKP